MRLFALSLVVSIAFLALSVRAIRRHRLSEHTGMLWLGVSLVMVFLSATLPFHLLDRAARFVGIAYPPDLILLIAVLFLFAFTFQLSMGQAQLNEKNTKLAQAIGILTATPPQPPRASSSAGDEGPDTAEPEWLAEPERTTEPQRERAPSEVVVVAASVTPAAEAMAPEGSQRPGLWSHVRLPALGPMLFRRGRHAGSHSVLGEPSVIASPATIASPAPGRRLRWMASFALLFLLIEAWSLSTPLMASPDEPVHTIKAAAVVRGEFFGTPARPTRLGPSSQIIVRVPDVFAELPAIPSCFATHPTVPASCAPTPGPSTREVKVATAAGRYEPLYYAIVGLPSLVFPSSTGIWLMRLVSGLLSALFLASALESAAACKRRRLLVWGVAVAATPMVMFMAGTINPNGLEASSAICLWASGFALLSDHAVVSDRRLLARVGISASVLVQVRGLSPLWLLLIALALVVLAGKNKIIELSRDRVARLWVAVLAASCAFTAWWLIRYNPLALSPGLVLPKHVPVSSLISTSVGFSDGFIREMIGVLGWLDVSPPSVTYYGWIAMVFMLLGFGLLFGRRLFVGVLVCLVVLTVALPIVFDATNARSLGFVWQGRYMLPLAAGIPIVAAGAVAKGYLSDRTHRRAAVIFPAILVISELALFFDALRRYTVGSSGPFSPFGGKWHPPFGTVAISLAFVVVLVAYGAWLRHIVGGYPLADWRTPPDGSAGSIESAIVDQNAMNVD